METSIDHSETDVVFGPFCWKPEQRMLFKGETLLNLGSRARGILAVLLERAGHLVKRGELIARVWGGGIVEEGTFRTHIALLRKALECEHIPNGYIETVHGLGYRFSGTIERLPRWSAPRSPLSQAGGAPSGTRMIGREGTIETLAQRLQEKRFITLVGPGGIGKTTVANAASASLAENYQDGVHFVDFSAVSDEQLVAAALLRGLNLTGDTLASLQSHIDDISNQRRLIVLDNCEHLIDAVAPLAETLLLRTTNIHVLATSREPLRTQGESVLRLPSLEVPPRLHSRSARDVLEYSAVRLLVELGTANDHAFELTDSDAPVAAEVCRRLDGLPLAIELAAPQVALFGMRGLAAHLDQQLDLLTQGRRTAPPRHRSLRATLQWSFKLLTEIERRALRRLSTISGSFDLRVAGTVVAAEGIGGMDVLDVVSSLTAKSMIAADGHEPGLFRLLQTTRSFALSDMH